MQNNFNRAFECTGSIFRRTGRYMFWCRSPEWRKVWVSPPVWSSDLLWRVWRVPSAAKSRLCRRSNRHLRDSTAHRQTWLIGCDLHQTLDTETFSIESLGLISLESLCEVPNKPLLNTSLICDTVRSLLKLILKPSFKKTSITFFASTSVPLRTPIPAPQMEKLLEQTLRVTLN